MGMHQAILLAGVIGVGVTLQFNIKQPYIDPNGGRIWLGIQATDTV